MYVDMRPGVVKMVSETNADTIEPSHNNEIDE
jgi:hypothetical protein